MLIVSALQSRFERIDSLSPLLPNDLDPVEKRISTPEAEHLLF